MLRFTGNGRRGDHLDPVCALADPPTWGGVTTGTADRRGSVLPGSRDPLLGCKNMQACLRWRRSEAESLQEKVGCGGSAPVTAQEPRFLAETSSEEFCLQDSAFRIPPAGSPGSPPGVLTQPCEIVDAMVARVVLYRNCDRTRSVASASIKGERAGSTAHAPIDPAFRSTDRLRDPRRPD